MTASGHPDGTDPRPAAGGRRRLVVAVVVGLALLAALVGLQFVDEGDGPARSVRATTSSVPAR